MARVPRVAIIGGGIAGLAAAVALHRRRGADDPERDEGAAVARPRRERNEGRLRARKPGIAQLEKRSDHLPGADQGRLSRAVRRSEVPTTTILIGPPSVALARPGLIDRHYEKTWEEFFQPSAMLQRAVRISRRKAGPGILGQRQFSGAIRQH